MDEDGSLRLEYEAASELLRSLTETRFKLLALVPTLAGAVVGFASTQKTGVALLAIGHAWAGGDGRGGRLRAPQR